MAYQTTVHSDQQQQYRSYSSTYYNPENHDQGPVSSVPSRSNPASSAVPLSLAAPAEPGRQHGYPGLGRRDSSPVALVSPIVSRRGSMASAHSSIVSGFTANTAMAPITPQNVRPAPAYVAHSGAVQVVSDHRSATRQSSSDDEGTPKDDVRFSADALVLVNSFLDELLYNFLSHARSTGLPPLKEAITEVLKQRLARDAVLSAEGELRELLAGNEEEEETNTQLNTGESHPRWDLELVWKRTRLRVMVYMRLGEMEDEDEERCIKEEDMLQNGERRFSHSTGLVSWAAAIFLTSVLEYIAEQTLQVVGSAAYRRVRRQSRTERSAGTTGHLTRLEPVTVEEYDVEKVALDPVLGRLWRTWRRSLRNASGGSASDDRPSASRDGEDNTATRGSFRDELENGAPPLDSHSKVMGFEGEPHPEHVLASNIALPLGARDVDEIEVPGLAEDPDAQRGTPPIPLKSARRRNSATLPYLITATGGLPPLDYGTDPTSPTAAHSKPPLVRRRSRSVPTPVSASMPSEEMPGAFPTEEQPAQTEAEVLGNSPRVRDRPEQKANAAEMAPHKRLSRLSKDLLNAETPAEEAPPGVENEPNGKSEEHGIVAGVVAGASVVVAAAAAVVYHSGEAETGPEPPAAEENGVREHQEAQDRRKSLVGMKALAATSSFTPALEGSETSLSQSTPQKVSPARPVTPPAASSPARTESVDSFTLGGEQPGETTIARKSPRKRLSMSGNMLSASTRIRDSMGMSWTPDRTRTPSPGNVEVEQRARSTSRLYLDSTLAPEHAPAGDDMQLTESPTQADFPLESRDKSQSRSMTEQDQQHSEERTDVARPLQSVEQARQSLARPPGRRISVPGAALTGSSFQSLLLEKSQHRQSWAASPDQVHQDRQPSPPRPWMDRQYPVPATAVASWSDSRRNTLDLHSVQERAAAVGPWPDSRRNTLDVASVQERWEPTQPPDVNPAKLTSASIRGPEDFNMFASEAMLDDDEEDEVLTAPAASSTRSSLPAPRSQDADTRTGRSAVSKQATSADAPRTIDENSLVNKRRSVSRPLRYNHSVHKSGLMAREPRVVTESTRDFADFIRSTGPDRETVVLPILSPANRSTTSLHSLRSAHINGSRASSVERSKSLARNTNSNNMQAEDIPPVPAVPANRASKSSMQPRGATTLTDGNSDLIDFIRSGPHDSSSHRISRTVAPFRTTQDSDQLTDMGNRINGPGELDLSLNTNLGVVQSSRPVSKPTSSDSQTTNPAAFGSPSRPLGVLPDVHSPTDSEPIRKQLRNKDPYAAYDRDLHNDDDDGADDDEEPIPALSNPRGRQQEESLMDFLSSTGPAAATSQVRPAEPGHRSETSALSDFLKTSSPPSTGRAAGQDEEGGSAPAPIVGNQRRPTSKGEKKGKGSGFFGGGLGRLRGSVGGASASRKTYLDMP